MVNLMPRSPLGSVDHLAGHLDVVVAFVAIHLDDLLLGLLDRGRLVHREALQAYLVLQVLVSISLLPSNFTSRTAGFSLTVMVTTLPLGLSALEIFTSSKVAQLPDGPEVLVQPRSGE